jgi:aldehyde:ferredoxin oxidoreductase
VAGYIAAATGWDVDPHELEITGERIVTMRHAFNLREGVNELKWFVHPRIIGDPVQAKGPLAGVRADIEAQDIWTLGAFDWDRETTKPSGSRLAMLGLSDVAKDLYAKK